VLDLSVPNLIHCAPATDQSSLASELLRTQFDWHGTSLEQSDVHLYDGRETGLKIEEVRDIQQELQYQPTSDVTYIVILGLEKASIPAQQALLKMLEEPPAYARWLLITSQLASVLPTIQSRCLINDLTQKGVALTPDAVQETEQLLEKIKSGTAGDLIILSDTFSDRGATQVVLEQLILYLHQQPPTSKTVKQLQILSQTRSLLSTTNVNLKLALGECFLALGTA
jgi:DNA polymerase III gamma/tau subunit